MLLLWQEQEGGAMGDKNKIVHDFDDGTLDKIMRDLDHGRLKKSKSWCATHPAYYGTSIQQKIIEKDPCEKCSYFIRPGMGLKKKCRYPWKNPKDYDMAVKEYLPCKGKGNAKS